MKTDNMLAFALHQRLFKAILLPMLLLLIYSSYVGIAYADCTIKRQPWISTGITIPPITIDPDAQDQTVLHEITFEVSLTNEDLTCDGSTNDQISSLIRISKNAGSGVQYHSGATVYEGVFDTNGQLINDLAILVTDWTGNPVRSRHDGRPFTGTAKIQFIKLNQARLGKNIRHGKIPDIYFSITTTDPKSRKTYVLNGGTVQTLSGCKLTSTQTQTVNFGSVTKNDITATGPIRPFSIRVECKTATNIDLMISGEASGTQTSVLKNSGEAAGVGVQILEESILRDRISHRHGQTAITLNSSESFRNAKTFEFNYSARLYRVGQLGAGDVKAELNFILQPK